MNLLVLATTLTMTLPSHDAFISPKNVPAICAESSIPLDDLSRLLIWGAPIDGPVRVIADLDVSGREGQEVAYLFDDEGKVWTVWVTTKDFLGNESCKSNQIGLNLGPGIPDPSAPPPTRP